jgi:hypothetical protein
MQATKARPARRATPAWMALQDFQAFAANRGPEATTHRTATKGCRGRQASEVTLVCRAAAGTKATQGCKASRVSAGFPDRAVTLARTVCPAWTRSVGALEKMGMTGMTASRVRTASKDWPARPAGPAGLDSTVYPRTTAIPVRAAGPVLPWRASAVRCNAGPSGFDCT